MTSEDLASARVDGPDRLDEGALYQAVYLIRRFEETVLEAFPTGVFAGTTHTYLGQEANAVGVLAHRRAGDIVVSGHRCHGHFLAYGGDLRALFAELMGKSTGVCGGRGGSQHLQWRDFYSNGILGGTVPLATGMALAEARKGSGAVAILFLGDGAFGEGAVYEAFNMASLWSAPVLFVVENNHVAQTTPTELAMAGGFTDRFTAFGIPAAAVDSSDAREIAGVAGTLVDRVRSVGRPAALVIDTERFGPHSKGDDPRPASHLAHLRRTRDPVTILGNRLDPDQRRATEADVDEQVAEAYARALADPVPSECAGYPAT